MNNNLSKLKVWYGFAVLGSVRKKPSLSVIFDNGGGDSDRGQKTIKRLQKTFFTRYQTISEAEDGKHQNRILTEYSCFIYDKPFYGDIEKVLDNNYQADINNVDKDTLEQIREALREGYKHIYKK